MGPKAPGREFSECPVRGEFAGVYGGTAVSNDKWFHILEGEVIVIPIVESFYSTVLQIYSDGGDNT